MNWWEITVEFICWKGANKIQDLKYELIQGSEQVIKSKSNQIWSNIECQFNGLDLIIESWFSFYLYFFSTYYYSVSISIGNFIQKAPSFVQR
jgi:hypothetical protein